MLTNLLVADLKKICHSKKLPISGNRAVLLRRILSWTPEPPASVATITSVLMQSWFLAPFQSRACREGTMNEPFVISNLGRFLDTYSRTIHIEHLHEYGLLGAKSQPCVAASPDAIAVIVSPELGRFVAWVEVKSKCAAKTEEVEMKIFHRFGYIVELDMLLQPQLFKLLIPEPEYRIQLLHGMACGGLNHAIYVVASLRQIIRVVHLNVLESFRYTYMAALTAIIESNLSWVNEGIVPELNLDKSSHAVDQHSVQMTLDLWLAMVAMITEKGQPLPAGKHLLPEAIAEWNRCKGPIDEYSRLNKNVHSVHAHLGPVAAVWLRLIMTLVYNSFQSYLLSRSVSYMLSPDCVSFQQIQKHRSRLLSFRKFCFLLRNDLCLDICGVLYSPLDDTVPAVVDHDIEVRVKYNMREAYFKEPTLIARRKSKRSAHKVMHNLKQRSCIWCCRMTKEHKQSLRHCRHGRKTTWLCKVCKVPLCKVKRFHGQSCFDMWHDARILFDPCQDTTHVTTRPHQNRSPPPRGTGRSLLTNNSIATRTRSYSTTHIRRSKRLLNRKCHIE
jgi:hypothetical protein